METLGEVAGGLTVLGFLDHFDAERDEKRGSGTSWVDRDVLLCRGEGSGEEEGKGEGGRREVS